MITYGTMGHEEMQREFALEGTGGVACIKRDLAVLRRSPADRARLDRVGYWLETVRGASCFLGLMRLVGITHAGAQVVEGLRTGKVPFRPLAGPALTELLETLDLVFRQLARGEEWEGDPAPLLLRLQACLPDGGEGVSGSHLTFGGGSGRGEPGCGERREGREEAASGSPTRRLLEDVVSEGRSASGEGGEGERRRGERRGGLRLIRRIIVGVGEWARSLPTSRGPRVVGMDWGEG